MTTPRLLFVTAVAALATAGCAAQEVDVPGPTTDGVSQNEAAPAVAEMAAQEAGADAVADRTADGDVAGDRAVIRTASLQLRATDTAQVAGELAEVVDRVGGYIAGTDLSRSADGVVSGRFTFRIPDEELDDTLDRFDAAADAVDHRRLDERDVTGELTDLDAQLDNLTAYETELRELLTEVREGTSDTGELLRVFDRVNDVRSQIDRATARRDQLSDQVAMATVHVTLQPTARSGPVTDPTWSPAETFRDALSATSGAFTWLADTLIRFVVTVLPVALLLTSPLLLAGWLARRRWRAWRRRRTEQRDADATPR